MTCLLYGLILHSLTHHYGANKAVFGLALICAIGSPNTMLLKAGFVLVIAWLVTRTGSLWVSIILPACYALLHYLFTLLYPNQTNTGFDLNWFLGSIIVGAFSFHIILQTTKAPSPTHQS